MAIQEILGQDLQITFIFMEDEQYNDIVVKKAIEIFWRRNNRVKRLRRK
jgi:hypothetical protein